ncbi:MAG: carbamoyltransferase HypF [Epsilonproteobacteria bacterium]|nr:MAG: carbamoyltransferase HypF [Campylobacterota bacterium]
MNSYQISISGVVQGVGFRPFVYNLASKYGLCGVVHNDSYGVKIIINSDSEMIEKFVGDIKTDKPLLAKIDNIEFKKIAQKQFDSFEIIKTKQTAQQYTKIPPDISICKQCQGELNDSANRRYGYAFITCVSCGPRWSIIRSLPYDRANTSFDKFDMCEKCAVEYADPKDRRYHAQPIGCFDCGPVLSLRDTNKNIKISQQDMIPKVAKYIKDGFIVAIKGVGGYHLVCNATNDKVVKLLRHRKQRAHKPFAVMIKDIKTAKTLATINTKEQEYLQSPQRPVVVLQENRNDVLSKYIAPNIDKIGLFLPYSPIHIMLLDILNTPIVATSANISGEPLCMDSTDIDELKHIWHFCLEYNRDILNSSDDSVLCVVDDKPIFYRVARGFAPLSIKLPKKLDENILCVGANQKSTVCIAFENTAVISPHIGDIESIKSIKHFEKNINNLKNIYNFTPQLISMDKHPSYESVKYSLKQNTKTTKVQHHYAHIRSVLIEQNINHKVLGVSWDGTGYGDDGTLWGGEFIVCDTKFYKRVCSFKQFKLIGSHKAIKEPARVALSILFDIYGKKTLSLNCHTTRYFTKQQLDTLYVVWQKGINSPNTSSVGRLFDAVASLCDLIHIITYEGQSGAMMEQYFDRNITQSYDYDIKDGKIDISKMIKQMISENDKILIISKFYRTLVDIIYTIYKQEASPLVLGGGVFQNSVLVGLIKEKIQRVCMSNKLPPNDGAICLGQIDINLQQY